MAGAVVSGAVVARGPSRVSRAQTKEMVERVVSDMEDEDLAHASGANFGGALSGTAFASGVPTSSTLSNKPTAVDAPPRSPSYIQNIDDVESAVLGTAPRPSKSAIVQFENLRREKRKPSRLMVTGTEIHPFNTWFLSRFMTPMGKVMPRRLTGFSVKKQKKLARAIKCARQFGLLPTVGRYDPRMFVDLETAEPDTPLIPMDGRYEPKMSDKIVNWKHPKNDRTSEVETGKADVQGAPNYDAAWGVDESKAFQMQYEPYRAFGKDELGEAQRDMEEKQEEGERLDATLLSLEQLADEVAAGDSRAGDVGVAAASAASDEDVEKLREGLIADYLQGSADALDDFDDFDALVSLDTNYSRK